MELSPPCNNRRYIADIEDHSYADETKEGLLCSPIIHGVKTKNQITLDDAELNVRKLKMSSTSELSH